MTTFDIDRRSGIGASEAAAVLGLDRYSTAADVWARKVGIGTEPDETWPMKMGNLLEPVVAQLYTERTGIKARRHRRAFYDPVYPFLFSHLDRLAGDRVVEIKTSSRPGDDWGADGSTDVPLPVMIQTQLQMRHAGRRKADVVALLWGRDLRVYPFEYDPMLGQQLADRLATFWHDYVQGHRQPPLDGSDAARNYLARRYPQDVGEEIQADTDSLALVMRLLAARADHERAATERQAAENEVKDFMGTAATLRWPGGHINWRTLPRQSTDWRRVAEWAGEAAKIPADEWAELVAGNTTDKSTRIFSVYQERKP